MIGNQIVNLLIQFFIAMYRRCVCCNHNKHYKAQWEKDNHLNDFTSSTLMSEYLDLGKSFCFFQILI